MGKLNKSKDSFEECKLIYEQIDKIINVSRLVVRIQALIGLAVCVAYIIYSAPITNNNESVEYYETLILIVVCTILACAVTLTAGNIMCLQRTKKLNNGE